MKKYITNKDYPVSVKWIFKAPLFFISLMMSMSLIFIFLPFYGFTSSGQLIRPVDSNVIVLTFFLFSLFLGTDLIIAFIIFLIVSLQRSNFTFSLEDDFMVFHQGFLNKQQKNLPYPVIQNLILTQDIGDRLLGIYSLVIENAAFAGGSLYYRDHKKGSYIYSLLFMMIGFHRNVAVIPGLTGESAEELKKVLLEKMKTVRFKDDTSGL